jgi:hypothetical protein
MFWSIIENWLKKAGWLQAALMGLCLGIGFVMPALWWLSLLPVVWMIQVLGRETFCKKLLGLFALIWGIKAMCSLVWVWNATPIEWVAGMSAIEQIIAILVYWLTGGLWLASGGAAFGIVSWWLWRQTYLSRGMVLILMPLLWLGSELVAAFVFSFFTAGPGSFLQTYFSFGMVGYLLGTTPFGVWLAGLAGVYGLTIIFVTFAVVIYSLYLRTSKKRLAVFCALLYIGCTFIQLVAPYQSHTPTTVISVDTQFDADFLSNDAGYQSKAGSLGYAIAAAVKLEPDSILLPEDSRYLDSAFDSLYPNQAMSIFLFTHSNTDTILIDSGRHTTPEGVTVQRANIFDGVSKKLWQFDKQYLVPQGEYMPTAYDLALRVLGYATAVDAIAEDSSYRPGPLTQTITLPPYIPGVIFCFESAHPNAVRDLATTRALPFVAHPISHAWFHTPTILWQQIDVMLQLQARYSGVPIVSAGNMATGKLYLPNGVIDEGVVLKAQDRYQLREFKF